MQEEKLQEKDAPRADKGFLGETLEIVVTVAIALAIALGIRTFAFEPFRIPSSSMVPTLLIGDYLFVSKYAYGYSRFSMPFSPDLFSGRILSSEPERGDVIVFRLPSDPSQDYIKRLIGLPGDQIQVINGFLHVNGAVVSRDPTESLDFAQRYIETFPEGHEHLIQEFSDAGSNDNTRIYEVPEGNYFFMGDNRDNSSDSRIIPSAQNAFAGVGFVPFENLIGRAEVIFFSLESGVAFYEFWRWPSAIRFERIGHGIE